MTDQEKIEQLERQNEVLQHRLEGHREAIARWRRRVGVAAPAAEMELQKTEIIRLYRNPAQIWLYKRYYILPVEHAPELAHEAYAWLDERGLTEICEQIFFSKSGWIAVLTQDWNA